MKILILSKYSCEGPSSRYRFYNYNKYFEEANITTVFSPLLGGDYIKCLYSKDTKRQFFFKIRGILNRFFLLVFKSEKFDLIIIEKELLPNFPYFVEALLLRNKKFALDFDDYIAHEYKVNKFKRFFFNSKIDKLVKKAKFVTVGNQWYFKEFKTKNLYYLPTVIDLPTYPILNLPKKDNSITIVWIGSPSTVKYLEIVKPVLQKISNLHKLKFKVIGAKIKIEGVEVVEVNWDSDTEVNELQSADIGIMPLYDTLWEKGKCGFKLIQYMACNLPVISSPAPANYEIVKVGVSGFIANNEEEWFEYFELLLSDKNARLRMGKEGRKIVENSYSYQVWGKKYIELILNEKS